jgi:hypothetical protein
VGVDARDLGRGVGPHTQGAAAELIDQSAKAIEDLLKVLKGLY